MVYGQPAHNKAVKVRRLSAARLHKTVFGLMPYYLPQMSVTWNTGSYIAGEIASTIASWAASKGINYLCN
jgi:hypothetical protein